MGSFKHGYLADLDPTVNVAILQSKHHLVSTMKDGRFHMSPRQVSALT